MKTKLILWTAPCHSGKTTSAKQLADSADKQGFNIAGLLAPSIYVDDNLTGYQALDLRNNNSRALLNFKPDRSFTFLDTGCELAKNALDLSACESADLIIVDEFGPLELDGYGCRKQIDKLVNSADALIVLIVREKLVREVRDLYSKCPAQILDAKDPGSVDKVIAILNQPK